VARDRRVVLAFVLVGQASGISATRSPRISRRRAPRSCARARIAGCTIRPLRDVAALSIEASDLQADAAHRGLLILAASVRNRANYAIAYPHLELTLTDAADQPVVRARSRRPSTRAARSTSGAASSAAARCRSRCSSTRARRRRPGTGLYLFYP
jgi:hypothetical protein